MQIERENREVTERAFQREILFSEEVIGQRVKEMGLQITNDYEGQDLTLLVVMKGSVIFASDLMRAIDSEKVNITYSYLDSSRYSGKDARGEAILRVSEDEELTGNILIVEDLADAGHTLKKVQDYVLGMSPNSLKTCVFLDKVSRREVEVPLDYVGFEIPDLWVEGYGMDTDELNRCRGSISYRKFSTNGVHK